ncbi:GDP-fucose protein O-fucosyltransferase 2 [Contarinia nasturtii]|uniref:GDP-fucose protein O-fucosyltransferase 2 n=1 Tax=Contarinia nasturtii TaxID=265458 RepID=UPI0012D4AB00|nr:GDP-fucose protein O-fucosyltransferase 2 [Contarinia nasturtii]
MKPENLLGVVIYLNVSLLIVFVNSSNSKKVPALQIKQPLTCQYKDFFYSYFSCDKFAKRSIYDDGKAHNINKCAPFQLVNSSSPAVFLLYDVNSVEGFNLRRDVYIRMAVFLKSLRHRRHYENSFLVLPPFYQLYHWNLASTFRYRSKNDINDDDILFWNHFFDLESMKRYTAVIDIWEYFEILRDCFGYKSNEIISINNAFRLKHFESMFLSGRFEEKFDIQRNCDQHFFVNGGAQFLSLYNNFTVRNGQCVEFQGSAGLLYDLFEKFPKRSDAKIHSIAIFNSETVLHDHWGGSEYWRARRSMRFNSYLVQVANEFRNDIFNSTDEFDGTERPFDWQNEREHRNAKGGKYICGHLRRADFVQGREETTPSLRSAATQILVKLKELQIKNMFVSSDCTGQEFRSFKSYLSRYSVHRFTPSSAEERRRLKPGGIAIVDQAICSNARYFIGSYESTFTYRIYEEREIMGFPQETTFNTFCKTPYETDKCARNSHWPIVY